MFRNDDFSPSAVPKITRFCHYYAAFTEHSRLNCPQQWLNDMRKCPTISSHAINDLKGRVAIIDRNITVLVLHVLPAILMGRVILVLLREQQDLMDVL